LLHVVSPASDTRLWIVLTVELLLHESSRIWCSARQHRCHVSDLINRCYN